MTEQDYHEAARRADTYRLLAIPQATVPEPPRWPLYTVVLTIALAMAGLVGLRHAELRFVRFHMDARSTEARP